MAGLYRFVAYFLAISCFTSTYAFAEATPTNPCPGFYATPVNLKRLGDNYLAVHPKPSLGVEIDELFSGDVVCAFTRHGVWLRVQYVRDGRGVTGWSHSKYLAQISSQAASPVYDGNNNNSVTQQQMQQKQIIINVNPNIAQ